MDCDLEVSEFELKSNHYVHFRTNAFRKDIEPLTPPQLWDEKYPRCSTTGVALVLNNTKVDIPLNKESKFGNLSRGWLEGSVFKRYYTEVYAKMLIHSLDFSTLPLILTL